MYALGGLELVFEVAGEVKIRRKFEGVVANLEDMSPALERIATHFQAHMEQVFQTEGAATARGKWKPLSKRYAARKAKRYPGKRILEASGGLRKALTGQGAGTIKDVQAQELRVGATVRTPNGRWDLGLIHHKGTEDGRVPMRPIIDPPDEFKNVITREIRDHISAEA